MTVTAGVEFFLDCRAGVSVLRAARVGRVPQLPLQRRPVEALRTTPVALAGTTSW